MKSASRKYPGIPVVIFGGSLRLLPRFAYHLHLMHAFAKQEEGDEGINQNSVGKGREKFHNQSDLFVSIPGFGPGREYFASLPSFFASSPHFHKRFNRSSRVVPYSTISPARATISI